MNKRPLIYNTSDSLCRGKSLRYLGPWEPDRPYVNDEGFQDFVSLDGNLYGCMENNTGKHPTHTEDYWHLVLTKGEKGDKGDPYTSLTKEDLQRIWDKLKTKPISAYEIAKAEWPEEDFMSEKEWIENLESRVIVSKDKKFFGMPEPDNGHNVVRYDEQDRNPEARAIARKNIGAASKFESVTVGDEDPEPFYSVAIDNNTLYNHAVLFTEQLLSKEQQEQVQENLHLTDRSDYDNLRKTVERLASSDAARLGNLNNVNQVLRYGAEDEVAGTGPRRETTPEDETFVQAINRIIYYLGDPIKNEFVINNLVEEKDGIVESLNYIKEHLSSGTVERIERRINTDPTKIDEESIISYNFYRDVDQTDLFARIDIPDFICENPDLDPESEEFKKAVWDRVENPDYDPADPDSKKYLSRGPDDLTIKLTSYYEGKIDPETGEFVKDHPNAFTLYADIIEGHVKHLHLDTKVNTELVFTNYEHVLDDDYYYKSCIAGTPGFITIGGDISLEEALKHSLTSEIRKGLIEDGKFVVQINRGVAEDYEFNQLTTEAQTLREAINELVSKSEVIDKIEKIDYESTMEDLVFIDDTDVTTLVDGDKLLKITTKSIIVNGEPIIHEYYMKPNFYTASERNTQPVGIPISDQDAYQVTMNFNTDNTVGAWLNYELFTTPDPDVPGSTENIDFSEFDYKYED